MMGTRVHVTGIVQGVGFRPYVYNLAIQNGLKGWVCNTSAGVDIELTGEQKEINECLIYIIRVISRAY